MSLHQYFPVCASTAIPLLTTIVPLLLHIKVKVTKICKNFSWKFPTIPILAWVHVVQTSRWTVGLEQEVGRRGPHKWELQWYGSWNNKHRGCNWIRDSRINKAIASRPLKSTRLCADIACHRTASAKLLTVIFCSELQLEWLATFNTWERHMKIVSTDNHALKHNLSAERTLDWTFHIRR